MSTRVLALPEPQCEWRRNPGARGYRPRTLLQTTTETGDAAAGSEPPLAAKGNGADMGQSDLPIKRSAYRARKSAAVGGEPAQTVETQPMET